MLPAAARVGLRAAVPRTSAVANRIVGPTSLIIRRAAATIPPSTPSPDTKPTDAAATSPLAAQRLRRPVSPHLTIYKLEQTWFGASALNRIAGCALSGTLYLYAGAYVIAPLAGWHLESMSLAAAAAGLPFVVKAGAKAVLGGTFVFHLLSGLRHLAWDAAIGFAKRDIGRGTWVIWGLTALGGAYLGFAV